MMKFHPRREFDYGFRASYAFELNGSMVAITVARHVEKRDGFKAELLEILVEAMCDARIREWRFKHQPIYRWHTKFKRLRRSMILAWYTRFPRKEDLPEDGDG